ncbi:MAG: zeta toxin family protein [bacterium]|jgi:predicted ABC-type ATPase
MNTNRKELYVVGGSNGAGKTTFARVFLPDYAGCRRFINPDLIAAGLSPFDPALAMVEAGRLVLREIDKSIRAGGSFSFESTLSGKTYLKVIQDAKTRGYTVHLFYVWIPDVELGLARIRDRVQNGGHNVPENDVRRRFLRTLINLFDHYRPLVDSLHFFDNSGQNPVLVFEDANGKMTIHDEYRYRLVKETIVHE